MKLLELQQEQEERELLERDSNGAPATTRSAVVEQVAFGRVEGEVRERRRADYANAKSMPGSRRHSGELQGDDGIAQGGAEARRVMKGDGTNMNSFLFDDELDGDINSERLFPYSLAIVVKSARLILPIGATRKRRFDKPVES
jgi:hypothetical protein